MKDLKEQILEAVQDATDLTDNIVSIPILSYFLDGILSEQKDLPEEFAKIVDDNFWDLL